MQNALKQLGGTLLLGLCLAVPLWSQTSGKTASVKTAEDKAKTPVETRSLDAIIALDDANARIPALQQFLKANPNNDKTLIAREALVASYAQLGENHLNDNSIEKAIDAFQRAIRALPKQVSERFFEETVSRIPMAISTRGYRAEAVAIGKMLETRFANEPPRLAALGEFYLTIEASGEAITTLETAVQLTPEDARLHRALGAAYRMGLRIDEAIASYQLAVRYAPADRRAFYDLANLYRSQGAYEDALKLYRRQLDLDAKHSPSLKGLALALTALGKDDLAIAELNKARDLRGSLEEITQDLLLQTQLAFYYLEQNKLKQAQQAADAALIVEPRFSWARIVAAEILLATGKYFEAERHLIEAQKLANFPTLAFTLGKLYLIVEDFDGAAEQFAKAFRYSPKDKFMTRLGGIREMQTDDLRELLAPEHQAAIFLAEAPTSDELFRIAESLVRVNAKLIEAEEKKTTAKAAPTYTLEQSALAFVQAENSRRSFRALFMANKLAQAGRALPSAIRFAEQALELADVATEAEGSVRDYPNYDRAGRLHIFRGRAHDARGWALYKSGRTQDAILSLSQAVNEYGNLPEGKRSLWHLAIAHETAGALPRALEMYLAAYEAPANQAGVDIQRTVIETLYRKVNGSLNGLEAALGQPLTMRTAEEIAAMARTAPALPIEVATQTNTTSEPVVPPTVPNIKAAPTEDKPAQATAGLSAPIPGTRTDETLAKTNTAAASKPVEPSITQIPTTEPVRLGLLGIPVNGRHTRPVNKPVTGNAAPRNSANGKEPDRTVLAKNAPKPTEVPLTTPPTPKPEPVTDAPATATSESTKTPTESNKPETTTAKGLQTVQMPVTVPSNIINDKPARNESTEPTVTRAVETAPTASMEAAKPNDTPTPAPIVPVQLPEIDLRTSASLAFITTNHVLIEINASPTWVQAEDVPAPPATPAPKPAITAAVAATQATTEPVVTVRYENLPTNKAAAPAGESGHAISLPPSTRPRRVNETSPDNTAPANSRQRRVGPAPIKP